METTFGRRCGTFGCSSVDAGFLSIIPADEAHLKKPLSDAIFLMILDGASLFSRSFRINIFMLILSTFVMSSTPCENSERSRLYASSVFCDKPFSNSRYSKYSPII